MKSTGTLIDVIVMVYSLGPDSDLERAAMSADWVPSGKAYRAYIKEHYPHSIVCNNYAKNLKYVAFFQFFLFIS
jgi:hypothetical protein